MSAINGPARKKALGKKGVRKKAVGKKAAAKPAARKTSTRAPADADEENVVAGVRISHPERVLDEQSGATKLEVAQFYARIAPLLLPHVANRALSVVRCPRGFASACFFQKHSGGMFPDTVKGLPVRDSSGMANYLMVDSVQGLIALVQMNVIELHPWGSRGDSLERPDRMFFDLDPAPDVPWKRVVGAALSMREILTSLGMQSFVKTTGGKGLHVVVPLERRYTWDQMKSFSHAISVQLEQARPDEYISTASKAARKGRIFVDYLRNSRGATAVAPYSVRARPGASVSTPLSWKELESLPKPDVFHMKDVLARAKRADPWAKFLKSPQKLPSAVQIADRG
jgi:bifunctional non-homologous end joining protein LigD